MNSASEDLVRWYHLLMFCQCNRSCTRNCNDYVICSNDYDNDYACLGLHHESRIITHEPVYRNNRNYLLTIMKMASLVSSKTFKLEK